MCKEKYGNAKRSGDFFDTDRKNKFYTTKNNLKMKNEIKIENGTEKKDAFVREIKNKWCPAKRELPK